MYVGRTPVALAVAERSGRFFVASAAADAVSMRDVSTGRLLATVDLGGAPLATAVDAPLQHLFISTHDSFLGQSSVCMLDSRTGALLNMVPVGQHVGTVLGDARAERVLVASDGDLYLLDARTGQVLRDITGGGLPLAVDERDGHALIGGPGHLHLIATRDGALVAPVTGQAAVDALAVDAVGVDELTGRFYVATDTAVLVLDGRSGRMLRALSLPGTPVALAVDPAAQHVYVLTSPTMGVPQGSDTPSPLMQWLRRTLPWLPLLAAPTIAAHGMLTVLDTTHLTHL
jgi:DNA-binding beta-propeller fold protein YncE